MLINANQRELANKDTNKVPNKWVSGKVLYCSDGSLKAAQLIAAPGVFSTTLQYVYHGKIVEQRFDYTDLSNYTLNNIYRLPGKEPAYIFLLSKKENLSDDEQDWLKEFNKLPTPLNDTDFKSLKSISYAAVMLRLKKDSLVEVNFPPTLPPDIDSDNSQALDAPDPADSSNTTNTTTSGDTSSFGFTSDIKQTGKSLKPFFKYDTLKHTLNFLNTYYKQIADNSYYVSPVLSVELGTYLYKDTAFVLLNDTSYYYPSLHELDTIVAHKDYKVGKYIIKVEAIEGYEEEYGGYIHKTLTENYHIGTQTLTDFNNEEWDKIDLKPHSHLQNNGSLIFLLENETNGYSPGECGSGSHFDSDFWLVDDKSSETLFSFSTSTCTSDVSYTFSQNGKEISSRLYLIKPSDENNLGYTLDDSYWKDNSTYVFKISDTEKSLARNFYLHFNVLDKKNPVRLTAGKLYRKKK